MPNISSGRLCGIAAAALLVALVSLPPSADAVEMAGLYTVEVPLQRGVADAQSAAYRDALRAVLVRVTGSEAAADDEDLLRLFPNPGQYVLQFRRGEDDTLIVSLDGVAIEQLLRSSGWTVWGNDRPLTLFWIAVDRGLGDREIIGADDPSAGPALTPGRADRNEEWRQQVLAAAERRGIPVLFPLLDTEDLEAISFSDIWGGFDDALLAASERYGTSSVLVGRIKTEEMFRNRWSYYSGRQQLNWSGSPVMIVNLLADALAEQFAYAGNAPVDDVTLTISGVDSVSAFGTVQRLLSDVGAIENFRIDTVAGDEIRYVVQVQGGTDRLSSALEFSGVLRRPDWLGAGAYFGGGAESSLEYVYRPFGVDIEEAEPVPEPMQGTQSSSIGPN